MGDVFRFVNMLTFGNRGFAIDIVICEILFSLPLKLRKWKWKPLTYIILALALTVHFVIGFNMPLFKVPGLSSLLIFAVSILLQWVILDMPINRILFNSAAAYAVQNLAVNFRSFLLSFVQFGGLGRLILRIAITLAVYAFAYFFFARKINRKELSVSYWHLYVMSFITVFISSVLWAIFRRNGKLDVYTYGALSICCLLALMYQFSAFKSANLNKEAAILEQLLYRERKQYEISRETIDLINMKCHDLKKQMSALKLTLGAESGEIIGEAEKAVKIYESLADTGNRTLDLVLTEEILYCGKYDIDISVMADGKALDFMATSDIYSLFGNALSNAVESACDEEAGNRRISLNVHEKNGYAVIEVANFCTRNVRFAGGRPVTNKKDTKFHGYGIRSMEYIVEKYGGNMIIDYKDNLFTVKIIIKIPT